MCWAHQGQRRGCARLQEANAQVRESRQKKSYQIRLKKEKSQQIFNFADVFSEVVLF